MAVDSERALKSESERTSLNRVPPDAQANPIPNPTHRTTAVGENEAGRVDEQGLDEMDSGDRVQQRRNADARADRHPKVLRYSEHHRNSRAGRPVQQRGPNTPLGPLDNLYSANIGSDDNPWAPFQSKLDWEVAKWAKMRGAGSNAFTELLAIDGVGVQARPILSTHCSFEGLRISWIVVHQL